MPSTPPLHSLFQKKPEMDKLLEAYAKMMAQRRPQLQAALDQGDVAHLQRLGHQYKGSGGGYGYPAITEAGARLEEAARRHGQMSDEVKAAAEAMLELFDRAILG